MMAKKLAVKNAIPADTSATPSDLKNVFTGLNAIAFDSTEQNTTGSNYTTAEIRSPATSAGLHFQTAFTSFPHPLSWRLLSSRPWRQALQPSPLRPLECQSSPVVCVGTSGRASQRYTQTTP